MEPLTPTIPTPWSMIALTAFSAVHLQLLCSESGRKRRNRPP